MKKSVRNCLLAIALTSTGSSVVSAQTAASAEDKSKAPATAQVAEKPQSSPTRVVIEESWWYPLRFDFSNALHSASVHYRAGQEKAAASEIEKAATWLKYAQSYADKATQEDLATAQEDLLDFAMQLKNGKPIQVQQLEPAFAHASAALAKYHHFRSDKALAEGDMKTAAGIYSLQ